MKLIYYGVTGGKVCVECGSMQELWSRAATVYRWKTWARLLQESADFVFGKGDV